MHTTESLSELRKIRTSLDGVFGLVPTMGALHAGHCSLVERATAECKHVGVSIFVNPTQFSPGEDFAHYPRPVKTDLKLLEKMGVAVVWLPAWVTVDDLSRPLEGNCRPGHFRGVTTIVTKLFNSFLPDKAYFGQKDAQQAVVLKRMVRDLNFPVDVVVCPTVRESDGLALSSRNAYLNNAERQAATVLYRALNAAKREYDNGQRNAENLRRKMLSVINSEPLASAQYVSAADPETLFELERIGRHVLLSLAVRIGKTRLIDNLLIQ